MTNENEQVWYFTFGYGQKHPNGFIKIKGDFFEARNEMMKRYGRAWSMQYSEKQFKGKAEKYGLYEVNE